MAQAPSSSPIAPPAGASTLTKILYFAGAAAAVIDVAVTTVAASAGSPIPPWLSVAVGACGVAAIGLGGAYHTFFDHSTP